MEDPHVSSMSSEVASFYQNRQESSVLVFPPCNSYLRFQLHQLVNQEGGKYEKDLKTFSVGDGRNRRTAVAWKNKEEAEQEEEKKENKVEEKKEERKAKGRPDMQIYVPRARRNQGEGVPAPKLPPPPPAPVEIPAGIKGDVQAEIEFHLGGRKVEVVESELELPAPHFNNDDLPLGLTSEEAILEVHGFDESLKTSDLNDALAAYRNRYELKWVDDTHALAVFITATSSRDALAGFKSKAMRLRRLEEASEASKAKARALMESCKPARPRPDTSMMVARRMMGGALGMKLGGGNEEEREKVRKERERRREEKRRKREEEEEKMTTE